MLTDATERLQRIADDQAALSEEYGPLEVARRHGLDWASLAHFGEQELKKAMSRIQQGGEVPEVMTAMFMHAALVGAALGEGNHANDGRGAGEGSDE